MIIAIIIFIITAVLICSKTNNKTISNMHNAKIESENRREDYEQRLENEAEVKKEVQHYSKYNPSHVIMCEEGCFNGYDFILLKKQKAISDGISEFDVAFSNLGALILLKNENLIKGYKFRTVKDSCGCGQIVGVDVQI
jgi:hypothetical protein